jgi:hypothetical protein
MSFADVAQLKTGWSGELAAKSGFLRAKRLRQLEMPWNLVVVDVATITAEQAGVRTGLREQSGSPPYNALRNGGI